MYCLLRRCMSVLLALVFVGGLAACSTTTTGSDASRESSIATPAPVEPDTAEAFEEPEQAQAMAEPAEPQVRAEPAAAGEEMDTAAAGVTTGAARQADVAEGAEEFPIQRYEIEEPLEVEAVDDTDAEIDRLRRELAATESELERIRAEEEQRDYASGQDIASVDSSTDGAGPAPARTTTVQSPEEPKSRARAADLSGKPSESTIYFNYDQATVEPQFESVLVAHAKFLKTNPELRVEIQGNCDERGSREYNIALGQQRALTVKRALELLGVERHRIDAVSFGAEKPVAFGHDEDSWRLNRRADIVY